MTTTEYDEAGVERSSVDSVSLRDRLQRAWRRSWFLRSLVAFTIFGLWELAGASGVIPAVMVPRPTSIAAALFDLLFTQTFVYQHLWVTLFEVLTGYALGISIGFVLGALLGYSALARDLARPYIVAFQGTPKVVFAPLFVTAFGFGIISKVFMAAAISFFPILINTEAGMVSVDREAVRFMRSLRASRWQMFVKLSLPHSLPLVFAGLKTGLTLALVGALVAEFFGASAGLGVLLESFTYQFQVPLVWAVTAVLAGLGVSLFMIVELIHRKVVFWEFAEENS